MDIHSWKEDFNERYNKKIWFYYSYKGTKYDYMACGSYATIDLNKIKNFKLVENLEQLRNCEITASDK